VLIFKRNRATRPGGQAAANRGAGLHELFSGAYSPAAGLIRGGRVTYNGAVTSDHNGYTLTGGAAWHVQTAVADMLGADLAMVMVVYPTSLGGGGARRMLANTAGSSAVSSGFYWDYADGTTMRLFWNDGALRSASLTTALVLNTLNVVAFRIGGGTGNLWHRSISNTGSGAGGIVTGGFSSVQLGGAGIEVPDRAWGGSIHTAALFRRPVSNAEMASYLANPWQLYALPISRYWAGDVSVGSHAATGDLVAGDSSIAGAALHPHTSTGVLAAQDATVSGAALHPHTSTGSLAAGDSTVTGAALHPHTSTGALAAQDAAVSGAATHLGLHTSTGDLVADDATVSGTAVHGKVASGDLAAQDSTVAGDAVHLTLHTSSGALEAGAATVAGAALHPHTSTGALAAGDAVIAGSAAHYALHEAMGALAAGDAAVAGEAVLESTTHDATGNLSAEAAAVVGSATRIPAPSFGGGGGGGSVRKRRKERDLLAEREREAERALLALLAADDAIILALLQEQIDAGVFDQPLQ
jgi:hypothetical protein